MKKVVRSIANINMDELEQDLKFALHNRSDTDELLLETLMDVVTYHVNQAVATNQTEIVNELSLYFRNEAIGVVKRVRENRPKLEVTDNGLDW